MGRGPDLSETATALHDRPDTGRIALVLGIHYLLLTSMDTVIIGFPVYGDRLGLGDRTIGLLAAWFTGIALVYRFLIWHLVSRRGAGLVLALAAAASTLGPPLYLVTDHPAGLAAVRALHALAPGSFLTGTLVMLMELGPPQARGTLLGLHGALSNLSFVTAPLLALWLLGPGRGAPWLYGFSGAAGLAAAALMAAGGLLSLRQPSPASQGGSQPGPSRPGRPGAASAGTPFDRVSLDLLLRPGVGPSCLLAALAGMGFGGTLAFGAVHALRDGAGRPEVLFLPFALIGALARGLGARLAASVGYRPVVGASFFTLGAGFFALAFASRPLHLAAAGALIGSGFGAAHTSLLTHLMDHIPDGRRWGGATWFTTAFELGVTAGPAVAGLLADRFSLAAGLIALALAALAGAATAPFILSRARGLHPSSSPDAPGRSPDPMPGDG